MSAAPPRLLTPDQAREYLGGVEPESIGARAYKFSQRTVRYDRRVIDNLLDRAGGLQADSSPASGAHDESVQDELAAWRETQAARRARSGQSQDGR